jgi:hypothetical protein
MTNLELGTLYAGYGLLLPSTASAKGVLHEYAIKQCLCKKNSSYDESQKITQRRFSCFFHYLKSRRGIKK